MVEAHHVAWYDGLTNTSLARRVCEKFGANMVAGPQQSYIVNFEKYLSEEEPATLGAQQGPWICLLGVMLWAATILVDLWQVEHFAFALASLFWRSKGRTSLHVTSEGKYCIDKISMPRFTIAVLTIVLPRLAIDIGLLFAGIKFLAYENSLGGLILNAVALAFVLSLDELLFQLLPRNAQNFVQNVEPVQKTSRGVTKPGTLDWRSLGMFCACGGILAYTWLEHLEPRVTRIQEAHRLLCANNLDFVYAEDPGTSFVSVANTASTINLPAGSYSTSAVVNYTELGLTGPVLSAFTASAGPGLYLSESTDVVWAKHNQPAQQVLADMPCENQDSTVGMTRALYERYFRETTMEVLAGSFCARAKAQNLCTAPASKSFARALCPEACGCKTLSLYDRESCTGSCNAFVEDQREEQSRRCSDVTYESAGPEVKAFFQDVYNSLVASEDLEVTTDNRTVVSSRVLRKFEEGGGYKYAILNDANFPHSGNISTWATGGWGATHFEGVEGPCKLLPFFYNIFQMDLCATVGHRGTAMGFCPVFCGYQGCPSSPNYMILDLAELEKQQASLNLRRTYRIFQSTIECGQLQEVSLQDVYLIQQPGWGSGDFTIDVCINGSAVNTSQAIPTVRIYDLAIGGNKIFQTDGECLSNFSLHTYDRTRYLVEFSASQPIDNVLVRLSCHQDGVLSCGTSLNVGTAGAANFRGRDSPERIFGLATPVGRVLTFTACGEGQFDPQLDMYWYSPDGLQQGSRLQPQDRASSAACGGAMLTRTPGQLAMLRMLPPPTNAMHAVVVEGVGNTTGNLTLHTACSFPQISCGDRVHGNTAELTNVYAGAGKEMIWRFLSGNAAVNVSFDTCQSGNFDTDLYLYDSNMTLLRQNDYFNITACRFTARIDTTVQPNTELNILLEGWAGTTGDYHLSVTCAS